MTSRNPRWPWLLAGALIIVALSVLLAGCTAARGTVATTPTADQAQAVRRAALQATTVVQTSLGILDETGKLLSALPVPAAIKNRYDCAILSAVGLDAPSAAVTTACGVVPPTAVAPLTVALVSLRDVSTCPGLRATISGVYAWLSPVIQMLETSELAALKMSGASLRVTVSLLASGGVACSA